MTRTGDMIYGGRHLDTGHCVLLSGSESRLDDGDSDIGNSIATVSRVYREDTRKPLREKFSVPSYLTKYAY